MSAASNTSDISELFSVCQFFEDESYEYVRRFVTAEEAVKAAQHYTTSPGARLGFTRRVIITDTGDSCVFEWKFGEGITWPVLTQAPSTKDK